MRRSPLRLVAAAALAVTTLLAGCASDGIELNGGIFDALGVSSKGEETAAIPKVPERAGLVLPPDMRRLPPPGSGQAYQQEVASSAAWPVGPEARRVAEDRQKEAEHAAFCQKELQRKKLNNDLSVTEGPLGNCSPSLLTAIGQDPNKAIQKAQQGADGARLPR